MRWLLIAAAVICYYVWQTHQAQTQAFSELQARGAEPAPAGLESNYADL